MESADDWSYSAGLAGGWIPRNPTEKRYVRSLPLCQVLHSLTMTSQGNLCD